MGIPETDWKKQQRTLLDWAAVAIAAVLLAAYLYLWWTEAQTRYVAIALVLLAWGGVYFTDYWQPVLYLVVAIALGALVALWVVDGSLRRPLVQATALLNLAFVLLAVYLFVSEDRQGSMDSRR